MAPRVSRPSNNFSPLSFAKAPGEGDALRRLGCVNKAARATSDEGNAVEPMLRRRERGEGAALPTTNSTPHQSTTADHHVEPFGKAYLVQQVLDRLLGSDGEADPRFFLLEFPHRRRDR